MKRTKLTYLLFSCLLLCLFCFNVQANITPKQYLQDPYLAELIQARMLNANAPALAVSIEVEGEYKRFIYGMADQQKQILNSADTVYEVGSMSKAFTGLAVQILIAQGQLSLNDDIHHYLPNLNLRYQGQPAKLEIADFLYHTSGLPFSTLATIEIPSSDTIEQQLQNLNLQFEPKSRFFYTSANYDVLGAVIEKVTGLSYHDAIAMLITEPFGMSATAAISGDEPIINKATGYKIGFRSPVVLNAPKAYNHVPSAYIHSTLTDMEKWMNGLLYANKSTPILQQAVSQSWQGNQAAPVDESGQILYGSGWFIEDRNGTYINHGGENPNFSSCLVLRPDEQIGIVALANTDSNIIVQLCSDIDNYLHRQPYGQDVRDLLQFMDFIFTVLSILLLITITVIAVRLGRRIYRHRRNKGVLTLHYKDWLMIVGIPLIIAGIVYFIPSFCFAINWSFILLWLPFSLPWVLILLMILIILVILNRRIKKSITRNEVVNNE